MPQKKSTPLVCPFCGKTFLVRPVDASRRRYCSTSCARHDTGLRSTPKGIAKFLELVDRSGGPNACWPWMGAKTLYGYGRVLWNERHVTASRAALEIHLRRHLTKEEQACHTCDNPPCCNPAHLFVGTKLDNMRDAAAKGRTAQEERNGAAVLTREQVAAIKASLLSENPPSFKALSRAFNVTDGAIRKIAHGQTWRSVPPMA